MTIIIIINIIAIIIINIIIIIIIIITQKHIENLAQNENVSITNEENVLEVLSIEKAEVNTKE
jgi:hypothetical protein